jgi:hypothetical protein
MKLACQRSGFESVVHILASPLSQPPESHEGRTREERIISDDPHHPF